MLDNKIIKQGDLDDAQEITAVHRLLKKGKNGILRRSGLELGSQIF